jgi:uncharacterized membrane protein
MAVKSTGYEMTRARDPVETRRGVGDPAALLGAAALGATLMYFLDAERGTRRRHLLRDRLAHAGRVVGDGVSTTGRDLGNRARGVAAEARARVRPDDADDRVVEERVRAELGRVVSHPGAVIVTAEQGRVLLAGPVLAREAAELVSRVGKVRGVERVEDRLQPHETADGVPELQGGRPRRGGEFELAQENWSPAARLVGGLSGGALAFYGARRSDAIGTLLGVAGLALFARGSTNTDLGRLVGVGGGRRAVDIQKSITVNAPVGEVFGYFTDWENFPRWMSHVREVGASGERGAVGERTHWVVDGPAGSRVEWDAETTRLEPNELVAWKSVEGAAIRQSGTIRFEAVGEGSTRVHVRMSYNPPAGAVGHAVASLFGRDPKRQMDDDLARLKTTIETGKPPRDAVASQQATTA